MSPHSRCALRRAPGSSAQPSKTLLRCTARRPRLAVTRADAAHAGRGSKQVRMANGGAAAARASHEATAGEEQVSQVAVRFQEEDVVELAAPGETFAEVRASCAAAVFPGSAHVSTRPPTPNLRLYNAQSAICSRCKLDKFGFCSITHSAAQQHKCSSVAQRDRLRQRRHMESPHSVAHHRNSSVCTCTCPTHSLSAPRSHQPVCTQVASRTGVHIPTSCLNGSCGTCEVEVSKTSPKTGARSTAVVRACVAGVPRNFSDVTVSALTDPIWGAPS